MKMRTCLLRLILVLFTVGCYGGEVQIKNYPYHVVIMRNGETWNICGGAIVSKSFALTLGSCVFRTKPKIALGMDNLNTLRNKDLLKHFEDIPASNIYYSKGRVLALIKFDEDITAFTKEQPVEIDTTKNDMNYTQQTGVITTFARNKRMYSVDVEILAKHICARKGEAVGDIEMCAVETPESKEITLGRIHTNDGSPLVLNNKLVGIVRRLLYSKPIRLYKIGQFTDWIEEVIGKDISNSTSIQENYPSTVSVNDKVSETGATDDITNDASSGHTQTNRTDQTDSVGIVEVADSESTIVGGSSGHNQTEMTGKTELDDKGATGNTLPTNPNDHTESADTGGFSTEQNITGDNSELKGSADTTDEIGVGDEFSGNVTTYASIVGGKANDTNSNSEYGNKVAYGTVECKICCECDGINIVTDNITITFDEHHRYKCHPCQCSFDQNSSHGNGSQHFHVMGSFVANIVKVSLY